jgi:hypothetical protein
VVRDNNRRHARAQKDTLVQLMVRMHDFSELRQWLRGEGTSSVVEYFPQSFNPDILQSTYSGGARAIL